MLTLTSLFAHFESFYLFINFWNQNFFLKTFTILENIFMFLFSHLMLGAGGGGGGYSKYFLRGVRPEIWNPYPYLRIFLLQETADLTIFRIFHKLRPISKGFSMSKRLIFKVFSSFCKIGPSSKDLCDQSGTHV